MEKQISDFDSLKVFSLLYKNKLWIILFTLIGTLISIAYALWIPIMYKSTVVMVPPKSSESLEGAVSSLSSTLKEIGLTKLSGSSSESYSILVLLNSRQLVDSIIKEFNLAKVYDLEKKNPDLVRATFLENCEIAYFKEGNFEISIWDTDKYRAAKIANRYVELTNNLALNLYKKEAEWTQINFEMRLKSTDSTLRALADSLQKFSSKTLLFSPTDQAKTMATSIAELKSQELKFEIMREYYKNLYGENDYQTKNQQNFKNEIKNKIEQIQNDPGFVGNFSAKNATSVGIEFLRLQTEFEAFSKLKIFLLPMIEKAKLDQIKDLKNLIILDKAEPAFEKDRPKRSLIVLGSCIGSFVLITLLIIFIDSFKNFKRKLI